MAENDLLDEIDELKDRYDTLQIAYDTLKEETDDKISALEDKVSAIRAQTEKEWRIKLKNFENDAREKSEMLMQEVDTMRAAFTGDAGGWEEKVTKSGIVYYENSATGETRDEEPECLYIAKAMKKIDEAIAMKEELDKLKVTYTACEKKRREGEIIITKMKTEMNSLKKIDGLWKESAKTVAKTLIDTKALFDVQLDQINDGLTLTEKATSRCKVYLPSLKKIKDSVMDLQKKQITNATEIMQLNGSIRSLKTDLDDKNKKVDRLSKGLEDEIERLSKPMRDKIADTMLMMMKEKAARAQERREIADLWPKGYLLPTFLMKYRALTEAERLRRTQMSLERQASIALSLEIKENVVESKMWEMKYDDYGRPFFQHKQTGVTMEEEPEITKYKPPPGRDEMGNLTITPDADMINWAIQTDYKGEVCYRHKETNEIRHIPPGTYSRIPKAKSRQKMVAEAAQLVLLHIKDKITQHIEKMNGVKRVYDKNDPSYDGTGAEEAGDDENLAVYQYDIETVEMLAEPLDDSAKLKEPHERRKDSRAFLAGQEVRSFDKTLHDGPNLRNTDVEEKTPDEMRKLVEELASREEQLEGQLANVRTNLKDFSHVLLQKVAELDKAKAEERRRVMCERAQARSEQLQKDIAEARKRFKLRKRQERKRKDIEALLELNNNCTDEKDEVSSKKSKMEGEAEASEEGGEGEGKAAEDAVAAAAPSHEEVQQQLEKLQQQTEHALAGDSEEKDGEPATDGSVEMEAAVGGSVDDSDDESVADDELGVVLDEPILLFGDPDLEGLPDSNDLQQTLNTAEDLSNLALFCGYANIRMDNIYDDSTTEFNLNYTYTDNRKVINDDEWLTKSFFVTVTPDRLDAMREATTPLYDPTVGLLGSGSLTSARLNEEGIRGAVVASHTPSVKSVSGELIDRQIEWKERQLMAEVLKYQLQQESLREAVKSRYLFSQGDGRATRADFMNRGGLGPLAQVTLKNFALHTVAGFQLSSTTKYFVQFTLGEFDARSRARYANRDTYWNEVLNLLVPQSKLVLESLVIEIIDDSTHVGNHNIVVARQAVPLHNLCVGNMGNDMVYEFEFKEAAAIVSIPLVVDSEARGGDGGERGVEEQGEEEAAKEVITHGKKTALDDPVRRRFKIVMSADYAPSQPPENSDPEGLRAREKNIFKRGILERAVSTDFVYDGALGEEKQSVEQGSNGGGDVEIVESSDGFDTLSVHNSSNYTIRGSEDASIADFESAYSTSSLFKRQQNDFSDIVAMLRGDSDQFIRMVIGDVSTGDLTATKSRVATSVKKMPDTKEASKYLQRKMEIHEAQVLGFLQRAEETHAVIEGVLDENRARSEEKHLEVKRKFTTISDQAEKIRGDIAKIVVEIAAVSNPLEPPIEPAFEKFPPLAYPPSVNGQMAIDEKGKKKKPLAIADFKALLDKVEAGELDGEKDFEFTTNFPSQAQVIKLNKSIADRSEVLDAERREQEEARQKVVDGHMGNVAKWERDEKKRKNDLAKQKKESRKAYLKLESAIERANRLHVELSAMDFDSKAASDMHLLHQQSRERFRAMRMKTWLEKDRQRKALLQLKKKLLRTLDARKRALNLPFGAVNEVQFEELRCKAEECFRLLRFEVLDVKQQLLAEGVRLRTLMHEEHYLAQAEMNRALVLKEVINQRKCTRDFMERNQYEVIHLLNDLEKLKIIEADKDNGLRDTVDNLGDRFTSTKKWKSAEVDKCVKMVELVMAKIQVAEGVLTASCSMEKSLLESLGAKWVQEFAAVRDSWAENSDYERTQKLASDCVNWLALQRARLGEKERADASAMRELQLQVQAYQQQSCTSRDTHLKETSYISDSSFGSIKVLQNKLADLTASSTSMQVSLEASITELSRDLQSSRERNLTIVVESEKKQKLLWDFIHTLQRTVQALQAQMEIMNEESERVVIRAKLDSDKLKHELRVERKHCSNLLFILHGLRGTVKRYQDLLSACVAQANFDEKLSKEAKAQLRTEIWEHVFSFTRLSTDVDSLFEFFASRLANLAGSRKSINDAMARCGASVVLAALCKSPKATIRKFAARALGGLGWDSFTETRILVWDCVMYWKLYKQRLLEAERQNAKYTENLELYKDTGDERALLNLEGKVEEFTPSGNLSLRALIKQRRQWALRAARRVEGPNLSNMKLINIRDGIIPSLLELCIKDGELDWEIARNAALAICVASYEIQNHADMTNNAMCVKLLVKMCYDSDAEVQTHAAVTIANLCHKDENAQEVFGRADAIPALLAMCGFSLVDLLEAATAALANMTCYNDENCGRVIRADGVKAMVRLIVGSYSENLLNLDQNDEVHANACEMLANVSRFNTADTSTFFDGPVIDALVVMCASENKMVKRHVPLVLGNIGQSDVCRLEIGERGGIEALFLALEDEDNIVLANTLWSLCNLMWYPPNQERAGRFVTDVLRFLSHPWLPISSHANILLANILYYNNPNRIRLLEVDDAIESILDLVRAKGDPSVVESALRSVLSLSYLDNVAIWLGSDAQFIPVFISLLFPPIISRDTMRYTLEIISNLCVHHDNRKAILEHNGIEAIVNLYSDSDRYIQDLAQSIIVNLEDVTPVEVLSRMKADMGLERMVTLASDSDPIVRAVAAEAIGEEVWKNPSQQRRAHEVGGVDALLAIVASSGEPVESVLPGLWSLRNLLANNLDAQNQFNYRDGVVVVVRLLSRAITGVYIEQSEKIIEASLALLVQAIVNHERNSRKLLSCGLEVVMDIVDGKLCDSAGLSAWMVRAIRAEGVSALAKYILTLLGPYNYVVCKNCSKKQDLHGQSCYNCGYKLLLDDYPPNKAQGQEERKDSPPSGKNFSAAATTGQLRDKLRKGGMKDGRGKDIVRSQTARDPV